MDLTTLKSRIRALVDDPDATYATDAFLLPLINQKYEELYNRMLSTGAEFERKVVELFNVPAQTQDLSAYTLLQDNAIDDVMQYLTRKDQAKVRRVGRISRRTHVQHR